jgi:hypothetical protein
MSDLIKLNKPKTPPPSTSVSPTESTTPTATLITQETLDAALTHHQLSTTSQNLSDRSMSIESDSLADNDIFYDSQEEVDEQTQNPSALSAKSETPSPTPSGLMSVIPATPSLNQSSDSIPSSESRSVPTQPKQSFFKKTLSKITAFFRPKTPEFKLNLTNPGIIPAAKQIHKDIYENAAEIRKLRNIPRDTNAKELELYSILKGQVEKLKQNLPSNHPMIKTLDRLLAKFPAQSLTINHAILEIDPILNHLFPALEQHQYVPTDSLPKELTKTLSNSNLTNELVSPTAKQIHKDIYEKAAEIRKLRNMPRDTNAKELELYSILKGQIEKLKQNLPNVHPMVQTLDRLLAKFPKESLTINHAISEIDPILNHLFPAVEQHQYAATDSLPKKLKEALTPDLGLAARYETSAPQQEIENENRPLESLTLTATLPDQDETVVIEEEDKSEDASDIFDGLVDYAKPEYEYEAVDLYRLQESFKKKELKEVQIMGPMDINTLKIEKQLTGVILAAQDSNRPVFSIVNTGHGHWVLLSLIKDSSGKVHALCKNSFGNPTDELKALFEKREIPFQMHSAQDQKNGTLDCGLFAIKNMLLTAEMAKEKGTDYLRDQFTKLEFCKQEEIANLRAEYANMLHNDDYESGKNLFSSK